VDAIFFRVKPGQLFRIPAYLGLPRQTWLWEDPPTQPTWGRSIDDGGDWTYPDSSVIIQNVSVTNFKLNLRRAIEEISSVPELKHVILWTHDEADVIPPYHLGIIASNIDLSHLDYETIPHTHILMEVILASPDRQQGRLILRPRRYPTYSLLPHSTYFPNPSP